jgi:O-antigen/teichoic acid export membrane protein
MTTLRKSVLITFLSSNGATVISFATILVLSRLLTPAEVGIFSMTAAMVAFAHTFREFGISGYIQQEKDLTDEKLRAATGVMVASSLAMGGVLFMASGWLADYFKQPGIRPVMQVLAVGFVFIPLGAITNALLSRELRAREQALSSIAGVLTYNVAVLVLAYAGFSYMAMAWANLLNIIVSGISLSFFRPPGKPWMPSLRGWRGVVRFGGGSIIGSVVTSINNALPDLMLGKMGSARDVGLLSRANATAGIFMQIAGPAVNYAVVPFMSRKHHAGDELHTTLAKACSYLTVLSWPPLLVTALFARDIVVVLYGWQWVDSAPVVAAFCLLTAVALAFNFHQWTLIAIGRPYLAIIPNGFLLLARVAIILVIYDGSLGSFAWGLAWAGVLSIPLNMYLQSTVFGLTLGRFLGALFPTFLVTLACAAAAAILHAILSADWHPAARLTILAVTMPAVWFAALFLVRHPVVAELEKIALKVPRLHGALGRFWIKT